MAVFRKANLAEKLPILKATLQNWNYRFHSSK